MQFTKAEPDEYYPVRFLSETGRWQVGLYPVLYGVRVQLHATGTGWLAFNYCAGDDAGWQLQILMVVLLALEKFPEDLSFSAIERAFPFQSIKPMNLDPECWQKLRTLAGLESA